MLVAFGVRVWFQESLPYPGIRDAYHYCSLSKNLAQGQGFVVDYVWHDLIKYKSIPHPDDWQPPIFALLSASGIKAGLTPLMAGKMVSMVSGVLLVLIIYALGRGMFDHLTGLLSAVLVVAYPPLLFYSCVAMTDMVFLVLITAALWFFLSQPFSREWNLVAAGSMTGLSYLARPTGMILLLCGILVIFLKLKKRNLNKTLRESIILVVPFLLVSSPWLIRNAGVLGAPTKSVGGMHLWTMNEGEFFDFDYARPDPMGVILSTNTWRATGSYMVRATVALLSVTPIAGLCLVGFLIYILDGSTSFSGQYSLVYLAAFFFLSGFNRAGGTWVRQLLPVIPLLLVFAAYSGTVVARKCLSMFKKPKSDFPMLRNYAISPRSILLVGVAFLFLSYGVGWAVQYKKGRISVDEYGTRSHDLLMREISSWLEGHSSDDAVIMTRHPWEINYYSDLKTVSAPSNGSRMNEMVSIYGVEYLIVDDWMQWPYAYGEPYSSLMSEELNTAELEMVWVRPGKAAIYRFI